jgi:plastocyanin
MRPLALVPLVLALAAPAAARADETDIGIGFNAFGTPKVSVLTGDTVKWTNLSVRAHTVTADDGGWASPEFVYTQSFSRTFDAPGVVAYYCRLHTYMRGEVDVSDLLLDAPAAPGADGKPYPLRGRAALGAGAPVTIEADGGGGFHPVASTVVGSDGSFAASVTPTGTASYRAVSGADASPPVTLTVLDRTVHAHAARHGRRVAVVADVAPATPGGTIVLQVDSRFHFGWWPLHTRRLDRASHVRFVFPSRGAVELRVVLTLRDGATPLAISPVLHVSALHRRSRRG